MNIKHCEKRYYYRGRMRCYCVNVKHSAVLIIIAIATQ